MNFIKNIFNSNKNTLEQEAIINNDSILLFTYGSMKKGFQNDSQLSSEIYLGNAQTLNEYTMHPASSFKFPYCIEDEAKYKIEGELYILNSIESLDRLDQFEGVPYHYYRKLIDIQYNGKIYQANVYFRSSDYNQSYENKIHISNWTKEFEKCGELLGEFEDQLHLAIIKS